VSSIGWTSQDSTHQIDYTHDLVIVKNDNDLIPLKSLDTLNIATLNLSNNSSNYFENTLDFYTQSSHYHFNTFSSKRIMKVMKKEMNDYNIILINTDTIHENMANFISSLSGNKKLIVNYYGQQKLPFYDLIESKVSALLYSPNTNQKDISIGCQIIFGGYPTNNKLKIALNKDLSEGTGFSSEKIRISYGNPSMLNINDTILYQIDTIVFNAIKNRAMPGCQVLAAKDGHVFYNKSFGHHTYDSTANPVDNNNIYDLASITKIASTALILMDLESKNQFSSDSTLGNYLPNLLDSSDYKNLNITDILTHQAGLASWIPFFFKTLNDGMPSYELYSKLPSSIHQNRVAEDLYMLSSYRDTIFQRILETKLKKKKKYKYSDLGYYFMNEIIKQITNENQDSYAENIYKKLGLHNIGYHPRNKWSIDRIPPTENDTLFRHQLVHGDVHDQGAALLGGVGGHAGLFSNANDLAVVMQMYLNQGFYGGDTILSKDVIKKYTSSPYYKSNDNRRGITFDKPVRDGAGGPTCFECASYSSFGHSGFTGNLTWADPESGILYVFLSNRVYPDAENHKLIRMNIRTEIMKVITSACDYSTASVTQ
tara:strand:- start:1096 stop:2886 length:1791 start_codon:yes stop_codon:yes gene_type:complete